MVRNLNNNVVEYDGILMTCFIVGGLTNQGISLSCYWRSQIGVIEMWCLHLSIVSKGDLDEARKPGSLEIYLSQANALSKFM